MFLAKEWCHRQLTIKFFARAKACLDRAAILMVSNRASVGWLRYCDVGDLGVRSVYRSVTFKMFCVQWLLIAEACEQAFHSERVRDTRERTCEWVNNSLRARALLLSIFSPVYTSRSQLLSPPDTKIFPAFYQNDKKGQNFVRQTLWLKKRCVKKKR